MGRTFFKLLRFAIGIITIALILRFVGLTWADVTSFTSNCFKSAFELLNFLKNLANAA